MNYSYTGGPSQGQVFYQDQGVTGSTSGSIYSSSYLDNSFNSEGFIGQSSYPLNNLHVPFYPRENSNWNASAEVLPNQGGFPQLDSSSMNNSGSYNLSQGYLTGYSNSINNENNDSIHPVSNQIYLPQNIDDEEVAMNLEEDNNLLPNEQLLSEDKKHCKRGRKCKTCKCQYCITASSSKDKKVHKCEICDKSFTKMTHLKAHVRSHTGERPYKCHFCPKAFIRSGELKRHIRIHTGEKNYVCDECGKRFTRSDHLSKHKKIHQKGGEEASSPDLHHREGSEEVSSLDLQHHRRGSEEVSSPDLQHHRKGSEEASCSELPEQTFDLLEKIFTSNQENQELFSMIENVEPQSSLQP